MKEPMPRSIKAYFIAVTLVLMGGMAYYAWLSPHVSKCHIVHAQHGTCPQGSTILKNFFTEKDGSHIDACLKPTGDDCVDELRPGESMSVRLNRMK